MPMAGRNSEKFIKSQRCSAFLYKFSKVSSAAAFYSKNTEALTAQNLQAGGCNQRCDLARK
jgi:hypothetical protein